MKTITIPKEAEPITIQEAMRRAVGDNPARPDDACHLRVERDAYRARVTALEATLASLVAAQDCSGLSRGARCARVKCASCDARALLEAAQ